MDLGKARDRSKVLESMALRNKIAQNIAGIKDDIALLKEVLGKIIDIYQNITKKFIALELRSRL
ncbi:hypothetical protein Glove_486g5 [Diversispora epigaea]|uniref:Uncharacterized protein n=1 Tax=Diversispora epigaea TaxID=1348612 RepID=A0A397GJ45_9GLOM|nr:hypothetical protein Glove_486g5 [Diversispora epigaea]